MEAGRLRKFKLATIEDRETVPYANNAILVSSTRTNRVGENVLVKDRNRTNYGRFFSTLEPLMSQLPQKPIRQNRYKERMQAHERLKELDIMDSKQLPYAVFGHD